MIDLKRLNDHIDAPHFHMHTISSVLNTVQRGDYAFKIDLQDAYFHVLIHPDSRKYHRFAFENKVYQFRVPFDEYPYKRHFYSLGLTDRSVRSFSPCYVPTPAVAGPIISHIRNPDPAFPGGFHNFHRRLYPGLGRSHVGFPDFGCLDPFRPQAPHHYAGAQGGNIGPPTLGLSITGPSGYDRYRQYHCCSLYQQTG